MDTQTTRPAAPKGAQQKGTKKPKAPAKGKAPGRSGKKAPKGNASN